MASLVAPTPSCFLSTFSTALPPPPPVVLGSKKQREVAGIEAAHCEVVPAGLVVFIIYQAVWKNTFYNLDKYIWQFGQIHLARNEAVHHGVVPGGLVVFQIDRES